MCLCERETETRDSLEFCNANKKNLVDGLMDAHLSDTGGGLDIAAPKGLLIIAIIRDPRSIQPSLFSYPTPTLPSSSSSFSSSSL